MASLNSVESIADKIASGLSTSVKTKFTNTDDGYASANGAFANSVRFNVLEVDETSTDVVQLTATSGTVVELTISKSTADTTVANKVVAAFKAAT